ncbi:hypothetical protein ACOSP7_013247 [Xanthoceras sorbifolium]
MNDQNNGQEIPNVNTDHLQHGNAENPEGQPDPQPRNPYYQHYPPYPPVHPLVNHYPSYIDPYYRVPPLIQGGYPYDNYQYHQPQGLYPSPAP